MDDPELEEIDNENSAAHVEKIVVNVDNKRKLDDEPIDDDEAEEEGGEEQRGGIWDTLLSGITNYREACKTMICNYPSLSLDYKDKKLESIDELNQEDAKKLLYSLKSQVLHQIDGKIGSSIYKFVATLLPGVDTEQLKKDLEDDTTFNDSVKMMIAVLLAGFPDWLKAILLGSSHFVNNLNFTKKKTDDSSS